MTTYCYTDTAFEKRPCASCEFIKMCTKHDVVCEAYYRYACSRRWKGLKQIPNTEYYQKLFNMEEVA
jgi:hypothetical protein